MTLFQMLKSRLQKKLEPDQPAPPPSEEENISNPLKLRVGSRVLVDELDHRQMSFKVEMIRQLLVNGEQYHKDDLIFIVDYVLKDTLLDGVTRKVRLIPDETIDVGFHAILLSKYHEQGYTDEFHNVINDAGGEFVVSEAGVEKSRYWRIDEVEGPVMMTVKELCDWDGNQRVEAAEIREFDLETWDFHRNTPIDGVEMEEFLFVEMSKVNGWFSLWIGTEIQPERIQLL